MLSSNALLIATMLRHHVGAHSKGGGPSIGEFAGVFGDTNPVDVVAGFTELSAIGFIRLNKAIGADFSKFSREYRGIVSVTVLEPMQEYLDDD